VIVTYHASDQWVRIAASNEGDATSVPPHQPLIDITDELQQLFPQHVCPDDKLRLG